MRVRWRVLCLAGVCYENEKTMVCNIILFYFMFV